jgi:hypothetical protein
MVQVKKEIKKDEQYTKELKEAIIQSILNNEVP